MSLLLDAFTLACVTAGVLFFLAGTLGLLRFPDALSRIHAPAKADTVGLGFIAFGLLPQMPSFGAAVKVVIIFLLVQLAAGAVSQIMADAARRAPWDGRKR